MLIARDVIRYLGDEMRHFRVIGGDTRQVVLFDLDASGTVLSFRERAEIADAMGSGAAELLLDHAFDLHVIPARLTEKQVLRRRKLLDIIQPLLLQVPDVFDDRARGRLVAGAEKAGLASAKTVHKALESYWRHGMSIVALTPAFSNCGTRQRKRGEAKLGRPRDDGKKRGVNTTPEIEKIFDTGLRRFYTSNRKNSLKAAYDMMVADFFAVETFNPVTGKREYPPMPEYAEHGYLSFRQFRFWYDKRDDLLEIRRKRVGNSK